MRQTACRCDCKRLHVRAIVVSRPEYVANNDVYYGQTIENTQQIKLVFCTEHSNRLECVIIRTKPDNTCEWNVLARSRYVCDGWT